MQNGCLLVMSAKAGVDNKPLVILVAEDDPNDVLLLKWAFARSQLHATLRFVSNGLEVISYLRGEPPFADRTSFPLPRLLLLDLHMPAAGGFDVLEWLADAPEARGLRVILFSSFLAPEDSRYATSLGAHSCLTKPLKPTDLVPIVQDLTV
jgi:CheY-like chemotaxis protein